METWKEIKNTDGKYSASNLGRIKCNGFYVNSVMSKTGKRLISEKIRVQSNHNHGYLCITRTGNSGTMLSHRVIAETFLPNPNNLEFVNHINGIKTDNRVENLEWVTRQEKEDHAFATGLKNSTGSNNAMAVLNEYKVKCIKELIFIGFTPKDLALEFGVTTSTIGRIKNNKIWNHV